MKLFALIMLIANPEGGQDAFVLDYDLSLPDCTTRMADFDIHQNMNIEFECEANLE